LSIRDRGNQAQHEGGNRQKTARFSFFHCTSPWIIYSLHRETFYRIKLLGQATGIIRFCCPSKTWPLAERPISSPSAQNSLFSYENGKQRAIGSRDSKIPGSATARAPDSVYLGAVFQVH
jgi:hypothetical protein